MKEKILIIEDEPLIRNELKTLLQSNGYETAAPEDFSDVIDRIRAEQPHLILLDIKLPGTSGFSLCTEVRTFSELPIIFVTSCNTDMDELNSIMLGGDAFITKPYDVVIFGYLKAVRDYFSDLTAQQFTFSTIANRRMKFCLFDYFRTQERRKRNMEVLSIHVGLYPDGAPLEDTIPAHDPIMQQLEMDLLLHELAGRVSKQQMDIVHLKQGGYGIREIARTQKVPMRRIKELLAEVHDVLLDICYG